MPCSRPSCFSSRHASMSSFSVNGSPTCTLGRFASAPSSNSCDARIDAPPMPSRPVLDPNSSATSPASPAARLQDLVVLERRRRTSRSRAGCRSTSGRRSLRHRPSAGRASCRSAAMPRTTPSNRNRLRSSSREPKRNGSSTAIGRAPSERMSRTIPPTPVAAPWKGSTADGWLCDSILNATTHAGRDLDDARAFARARGRPTAPPSAAP